MDPSNHADGIYSCFVGEVFWVLLVFFWVKESSVLFVWPKRIYNLQLGISTLTSL
jgi:hypothetical protein